MKRAVVLPIAAAGVFLAFAAVSLLVWATRGRNGILLARKLTLGALLINLTQFAAGCSEDGRTCYAPLVEQEISLTSPTTLHISGNMTVAGTILQRSGTEFSFRLVRESDELVQSGEILAADGIFDEWEEPFAITIDAGVAAGSYILKIYDVALEHVDPAHTSPSLSAPLVIEQ